MNTNPYFPKNNQPFEMLFIFLGLIIFCSKSIAQNPKEKIVKEIETALQKHVIQPWYPRSIDSIYGGYLCDFDFRWDSSGLQNKMIVSQARHTWSCSKFEELYPNNGFENYARHGFEFLQEKMWDKKYGGFYSILTREGKELNGVQWGNFKTAYGNSFGIYALAAYVMTTKDTDALNLAIEAFRWLDQNAYDKKYGGYFQFISREGMPNKTDFNNTPPKDQNSSIHLLEAFTELYKVWPDNLLEKRLKELLFIIRDEVTTASGYMNLFFNEDWSPVIYSDSLPEIRVANYAIDHVSFGHDVETAYLMMEVSHVLGLKNDDKTFKTAKFMVDHTMTTGWDKKRGGIYDRGYYFKNDEQMTIISDSKAWWSQVEALNTLLIMSELYPDDPMDYYGKFILQWGYIKSNIIDWEFGGVFVEGLDTSPESKNKDKGGIWKVNYHTARSLMNCMEKLKMN